MKKGTIQANEGRQKFLGSIDYIQPAALVVDSNNNTISAGTFFLNLPSHGLVYQAHISVEDESQNPKWSARVDCDLRKSSAFQGVTVDGSGHIYAAGYVDGNVLCTINAKEKLSFNGSSDQYNFFLAKFDAAGTPLWVRTAQSKEGSSSFESVSVDVYGNIYAAGYQTHGPLDLGGEITVGGAVSNVLIARFNPSGSVKWAHSVSPAERSSAFASIAVSETGDVYAVGRQYGAPGSNKYGEISLTDNTSGDRPLMVRYSQSGNVVSAYLAGSQGATASFKSVAIDTKENVYVAGEYDGSGPLSIGPHIIAGTAGKNSILAKFHKDGQPLWAKAVAGISFTALATDGADNLYAGGEGYPGNEMEKSERCAEPVANAVRYTPEGKAIWRRSAFCGKRSAFAGLAVLGNGKLVSAGANARYLFE